MGRLAEFAVERGVPGGTLGRVMPASFVADDIRLSGSFRGPSSDTQPARIVEAVRVPLFIG